MKRYRTILTGFLFLLSSLPLDSTSQGGHRLATSFPMSDRLASTQTTAAELAPAHAALKQAAARGRP
jgi:hypothetical protein